MKNLLRALCAAFLITPLLAPLASAHADEKTENQDAWRVLIVADYYNEQGGSVDVDSFPVSGDLEKCRRIAAKFANELRFPRRVEVKFICINTTTGSVTPATSRKYR
tara:strand:- start:34 stop:354 length:321 start_codon:yes stop_codon:yes gene_type:complete